MEGGTTQGAMVDIVVGTRFGTAPFKVEFKAGGGTVRVEGNVLVFDSNDSLAVGVTGNPTGCAVRGKVGVIFSTSKTDLGCVGQAVVTKGILLCHVTRWSGHPV